MKNTIKQNKIFQGCILFIFFAALSSNAWAQTSGIKGGRYSNDSNHSIIYDSISTTGTGIDVLKSFTAIETNSATQVEKEIRPELGEKLMQISQMIFQYIVVGETPADKDQSVALNQDKASAVNHSSETDFGLALTSAYINNQLLEGRMQLEFHANPMGGGGAIFLKKTF